VRRKKMRKVTIAEVVPATPAPEVVVPEQEAPPAKAAKALYTLTEFPRLNPETISDKMVNAAVDHMAGVFDAYKESIGAQLDPKMKEKVLGRVEKLKQQYIKEFKALVDAYAIGISRIEPNIVKASEKDVAPPRHPLAAAIASGPKQTA
jgi:hypothetical protein